MKSFFKDCAMTWRRNTWWGSDDDIGERKREEKSYESIKNFLLSASKLIWAFSVARRKNRNQVKGEVVRERREVGWWALSTSSCISFSYLQPKSRRMNFSSLLHACSTTSLFDEWISLRLRSKRFEINNFIAVNINQHEIDSYDDNSYHIDGGPETFAHDQAEHGEKFPVEALREWV